MITGHTLRTPLLLLSLALLAGSCGQQQGQETTPQNSAAKPPSTEKNTMVRTAPAFDGIQAFSYLKAQTDFGPRNPNSEGHKRCMNYLEMELRKSADRVVLQRFTAKGYNESLNLANVFAQFNPAAQQRLLLVAHWDSRPRGEEDPDPAKRNLPILGANDGASGVAILLQLARMMKEHRPEFGVDILLTDGEDYGDSRKDGNTDLYFLGARYFARTKEPAYTPEYGILLDMVGDRDLQIPMEQNSMRFAPQLMDLVWSTAEEVRATQFVRIPGENISDDHLPLNDAGIPTIDLIDFQYPHWHTHQDTPDKCSPESLEAVGSVLSALIYTKLPR